MRRLLTLIGVCCGFGTCSPGMRADDAHDLAQSAVKAVGGAAKLPKIVRWKETYFLANPNDKGTPRDAIVAFPAAWFQDGKNIAAGNPDRTEKAYLVWVWTLGPLLEPDSRLKSLPAIQQGDRKIRGLRLSRDGQKDIDLYFEEATHRLARIDWRTYQIDFDDWKETDGYRYPAKSSVRHADGKLHLRTEFQLFEILRELPQELAE